MKKFINTIKICLFNQILLSLLMILQYLFIKNNT